AADPPPAPPMPPPPAPTCSSPPSYVPPFIGLEPQRHRGHREGLRKEISFSLYFLCALCVSVVQAPFSIHRRGRSRGGRWSGRAGHGSARARDGCAGSPRRC